MKETKTNSWSVMGLIIALSFTLTGCVSNSADRIMNDARRYSAVTRIDPSFRPEVGARLVWFSDLIVQDEDAAIPATPEQVSVIQSTIESRLIGKNYRFTEDTEQADYMIAAALLMDGSEQSQQITELVQIFPGLASAFNDLDTGTLLVVISPPTDPRTAALLWRGAIQIYVVGEALSPEMRMSRILSLTSRLLDAVPEAGRRD